MTFCSKIPLGENLSWVSSDSWQFVYYQWPAHLQTPLVDSFVQFAFQPLQRYHNFKLLISSYQQFTMYNHTCSYVIIPSYSVNFLVIVMTAPMMLLALLRWINCDCRFPTYVQLISNTLPCACCLKDTAQDSFRCCGVGSHREWVMPSSSSFSLHDTKATGSSSLFQLKRWLTFNTSAICD